MFENLPEERKQAVYEELQDVYKAYRPWLDWIRQ